ncbi:hypothetical protein [Phenylobacterium montanum]|uniref:Uncharacterized protein n=1 Tax=Phenylobacterium montanum TaxID=2823693 RepID=A0A975IW03_9CAUL|nr:hypothetical protein [Caulobacter sp. S6]QUD89099.1 hypothetical protein KCG34_04215 [Caulobacter sp. S6]
MVKADIRSGAGAGPKEASSSARSIQPPGASPAAIAVSLTRTTVRFDRGARRIAARRDRPLGRNARVSKVGVVPPLNTNQSPKAKPTRLAGENQEAADIASDAMTGDNYIITDDWK